MEGKKRCDARTKRFSKQLKALFSDEEIASFMLTLLGMSDLAHEFIWEKVKDFMEVPIQVKYSVVQHAAFYKLLALVARDELKKENCFITHLPVNETSWKSNDDFEKRFVLVVKSFYDQLKKDGKV